jgi:hypothetical protein
MTRRHTKQRDAGTNGLTLTSKARPRHHTATISEVVEERHQVPRELFKRGSERCRRIAQPSGIHTAVTATVR